MQVAVAGVEDVRRARGRGGRRSRRPASSTSGRLRARHHRVVHVEVGREPAHRAERALARAPEALRARRRRAPPRRARRPRARASARTRSTSPASADGGAVELDQQHGAGVARIAGRVDAGLDRARSCVGRGSRAPRARGPRAMIVADRRDTPTTTSGKTASSVSTASGSGDEPHRHLGDDAERALAADERADQVVARRASPSREPSRTSSPSGSTSSSAEHVLGGRAVLQRVRAAASSRRRCRRSCRRAGSRDPARRRGRARATACESSRVDHAGLHHGEAVRRGSIARMRSMREHSITTPPSTRRGAAGEPGAGAARHERHAARAARAHDAPAPRARRAEARPPRGSPRCSVRPSHS